MAERADLSCGCAFVKTGGFWYQVIACPDHGLNLKPQDEPEVRGG